MGRQVVPWTLQKVAWTFDASEPPPEMLRDVAVGFVELFSNPTAAHASILAEVVDHIPED